MFPDDPYKTPLDAAFFFQEKANIYSQYTTTYRPNHTTSTKCQYHAAPSNPK